jgi:hypothetical protein
MPSSNPLFNRLLGAQQQSQGGISNNLMSKSEEVKRGGMSSRFKNEEVVPKMIIPEIRTYII